MIKQHCRLKLKTYHGDQWVSIEVEVREHALMKCIMDGGDFYPDPSDPNESDPHAKTLIAANDGDARLTGGSIASIRAAVNSPVELKPLPNDG